MGRPQYIIILMVLTLSFLSFGCTGAAKTDSAASAPAEVTGTSPEVTQADILRQIKTLASDEMGGRRTGTPGGNMAAEYIASEFRRLGLSAVDSSGDYMQPFEFLAGAEMGGGNSLTASVGGKVEEFYQDADYLPFAFSASGTATGDLVFAGYGISFDEEGYDDYEGLDVDGKVVLILRYHPEGYDPHSESEFQRYAALRYKAMNAREKGAAAMLLVTGPVDDDSTDTPIAFDKETRFAGSGIIAGSITRATADKLLAPSGKTIEELQKTINDALKPASTIVDGAVVAFTTDVLPVRANGANVMGLVEGSDPALKDEVIVIGAHYDHLGLGGSASRAKVKYGEIHNGADDNASGTAGMLELAEYFAAHAPELSRSILFQAYAAEEIGLLGSKHYVDNPLVPLERTVAMFNMDMIGRDTDTSLVMNGLGTSPVWEEIADKANEGIDLKLAKKNFGTSASDHSSFYGKNVPVLFFFTGLHDDYHKPSDDWEKINTEIEVRVVNYVRNLALLLDDVESKPEFVKVKQPAREGGRTGFRVVLGVTPDYAAEVEGLKITGVAEEGAAGKAGVIEGDIIIKMDDHVIKSIYDYMYVLQALKPGQEVTITVRRGEEEVELKAIMQAK